MPGRRVFLTQVVALLSALPGRSSGAAQATAVLPSARQISGIYPSLAMFNDERECGTGALAVWAGRLWAITYGPHLVRESSDKLYEITPDLRQIVRPESVGGTNANRFVHRESQQLFIGPYVIDHTGAVRTIPRASMPGRLTGTARHLRVPASALYVATMEEGLYEVDVHTLAVTGVIRDGNDSATNPERPAPMGSSLPGYHGKGLYSGQGRLVYANNGEAGEAARRDPRTTSGALAEWRGDGDWTLVRRNQFTEVSGPGGIEGARADGDPIWSIGWDHRSLILMLLDDGRWFSYRLPKASHCYDGAHGWNTEWPRIREVGGADALMTMHGMFWRFPLDFSRTRSGGLAARSTYLKVIGDFCAWNGRLVFGCDDTAAAEFLNTRRAKGTIAGPGQSQSNLWFVEPSRLDRLGPASGAGAVWVAEQVQPDVPSDPFLVGGFSQRAVHIAHEADTPVVFDLEVDRDGSDVWAPLQRVEVPADGYAWADLSDAGPMAWARARTAQATAGVTVQFTVGNAHPHVGPVATVFDGLARPADRRVTGGLLHTRPRVRTLGVAVDRIVDDAVAAGGYYELDGDLRLEKRRGPASEPDPAAWIRANVAIPSGVLQVDTASVLIVDDQGRRWRLPKGDAAFDRPGPFGLERVDREVCTERDLFNCHGTFYELPADNAGGFAKIRPICTHGRRIHDYCSYRGLLVMTGIADAVDSPRLVRSEDGGAAVWVGVVDDLWEFGRPTGRGGPWLDTSVRADESSDPYLMSGYQRKTLTLRHDRTDPVSMAVQVDVTGDGLWRTYRVFEVGPGTGTTYEFPRAFSAYWLRVTARADCVATATLAYE